MKSPIEQDESLSREKFISLLIEERNYHSDHTANVNSRFLYTIAGIFGFVVFSTSITFDDLKKVDKCYLLIGIASILIGTLVIAIGLYMHLKNHRKKRVQIEKHLNQLLEKELIHYNINLNTENKPEPKTENYLFTREPNYNKGFKFHDLWIIIGGSVFSFGCFIYLLILILKN